MTHLRRSPVLILALRRQGHDVDFLTAILVPADETVFWRRRRAGPGWPGRCGWPWRTAG